MPTEIERKFLVKGTSWKQELLNRSSEHSLRMILQGYLDTERGTIIQVLANGKLTYTVAGHEPIAETITIPETDAAEIRSLLCIGDFVYSSKGTTIRVRVSANGDGILTLKGRGTGISRPEYEYPINPEYAAEIVRNRSIASITKARYKFPAGNGLVWELDEFYGDNTGLYVAEIEMPAEDTEFVRPDWLGEEVTDDFDFTNVHLSRSPFKTWPVDKRTWVLNNTFTDTGSLMRFNASPGNASGQSLPSVTDTRKLTQTISVLWDLLDDIDTADDMFKPQDLASLQRFHDYVMRKVESRHQSVKSDGYTLFIN